MVKKQSWKNLNKGAGVYGLTKKSAYLSGGDPFFIPSKPGKKKACKE